MYIVHVYVQTIWKNKSKRKELSLVPVPVPVIHISSQIQSHSQIFLTIFAQINFPKTWEQLMSWKNFHKNVPFDLHIVWLLPCFVYTFRKSQISRRYEKQNFRFNPSFHYYYEDPSFIPHRCCSAAKSPLPPPPPSNREPSLRLADSLTVCKAKHNSYTVHVYLQTIWKSKSKRKELSLVPVFLGWLQNISHCV